MVAVGTASFPCIGRLGNRTGRNHVQQVLPLTLHSRTGLVGRQAGVDVRHGHPCEETGALGQPTATNSYGEYLTLLSEYNECRVKGAIKSTCVAAALLPPGGHAALAADL